MLKTEIFDILLHGEIVFVKIAVLLHGEIVVGEVAVVEISGWGNCCWGKCLGEVVTREIALGI